MSSASSGRHRPDPAREESVVVQVLDESTREERRAARANVWWLLRFAAAFILGGWAIEALLVWLVAKG